MDADGILTGLDNLNVMRTEQTRPHDRTQSSDIVMDHADCDFVQNDLGRPMNLQSVVDRDMEEPLATARCPGRHPDGDGMGRPGQTSSDQVDGILQAEVMTFRS